MQFRCPSCSQSMQCPDDLAGKKAICPKCGQKVLIPPPVSLPNAANKTLLGHPEPDGTRPDAAAAPAPIPLATHAPPAAATAEPLPPPTPTKRKIPRLAWVGVAVAGGLAACFVCTCGGVGIRSVTTNGAVPFLRPDITGKWEPANAGGGVTIEFKRDGSGAIAMPFLARLVKPGAATYDFRWHVEGYKKPILVIDETDSKFLGGIGLFGGRSHHHYTLDDGTLTLTPLQPGQPIVLRRAKAGSAPAIAAKKDKVAGPEFDLNNLDRTREWASEVSLSRLKLEGNEIALADNMKKFTDDTRRFVGKKIQWSVPVEFVSDTEVTMIPRWTLAGDNRSTFSLRRKDVEADGPLPFALRVEKEITRKRAAELKAHQSFVVVKGTIVQISLGNEFLGDFGGRSVVIVLDQISGE